MLGGKHWNKGKLRKIGSSKYWINIAKSTFSNLELSTFYNNFISFDCLRHFDFLLRFLLNFRYKNIEVTCVNILFYSLGDKHSMNVKQVICVAKMFVITSRLCCLPPQNCAANLHDKGKSNMAAIVNKVYWRNLNFLCLQRPEPIVFSCKGSTG